MVLTVLGVAARDDARLYLSGEMSALAARHPVDVTHFGYDFDLVAG